MVVFLVAAVRNSGPFPIKAQIVFEKLLPQQVLFKVEYFGKVITADLDRRLANLLTGSGHLLGAIDDQDPFLGAQQGLACQSQAAAYATSKGGLNALTRALAVDYGKHNIRANTLSPGYVVNDRRDADITSERRARYEAMHLTRLGAARDCAYAAVYLASRESEFLTGINLQLDGGSSVARAAVLG